jgi:GTPase SAR1 family protein
MSPNCFNMLSSSATQSSTTISSSSSSVPLVSSSSSNPHHTGGHIACVIIGDSGVGKSSLVVSYTTNDFPPHYIPTAFDNYSVDVSVGNRLVHFDICDTGGKVNTSILFVEQR